MATWSAWLLGIASLGLVFFATANLALHQCSWAKLDEKLQRLGRARWMAVLDQYERELICATAFLRMLLALLVVFLIVHRMEPDPTRVFSLTFWKTFLVAALWMLVMAVALPNAWGRYTSESFLARTLPALNAARVALWPIVLFMRVSDEVVRRLAGVPRPEQTENEDAEAEIMHAISEAQTTGAVDEIERGMIKSVIEFQDRDVGAIMTPRTTIVGLEASAGFEDVRQAFVRAGHSRMPVYRETLDTILGVLHARDILQYSHGKNFDLMAAMRKPVFVPEAKPVRDLLNEFQSSATHMAIVLDEYGGTAGLVTMEDILEELVGEITDEHEPPALPLMQRIDEQSVEVDARMRVDEINNELSTHLPEQEDYDTIGGLIFSILGKIPENGEHIRHDNVRVEVVEAEDRRINRVRITVEPDQNHEGS